MVLLTTGGGCIQVPVAFLVGKAHCCWPVAVSICAYTMPSIASTLWASPARCPILVRRNPENRILDHIIPGLTRSFVMLKTQGSGIFQRTSGSDLNLLFAQLSLTTGRS